MNAHITIGILGSDERSVALAQILAATGARLSFADPSARERAESAAHALHAKTGTPYHIAAISDVLVFASDPSHVDALLARLGTIPHETIVLDATPATGARPERAVLLAHKIDSHRVVRALLPTPKPGAVVTLCGDDPEARAAVTELLRAGRMEVADRGGLAAAVELERAAGHAA